MVNFEFDVGLLLLSTVASTIASLVAFTFAERLYKATTEHKRFLLPLFSAATATAVWGNHILISLALHKTPDRSLSMLALAWVCALLVGYVVMVAGSQREFKLGSFFSSALIASLGVFAMFCFDMASMSAVKNIQFDFVNTFMALVISLIVITAMVMILFWIKTYSGKYNALIRTLISIVIAINIIGIHLAFNSGISSSTLVAVSGIGASTQNKYIGFIIALMLICLFMMLFIFILFFEKHGQQLFKFSFLDSQKNEPPPLNMIDSLTKLPNRRAFQLHLESAAKRSARAGSTFALAYIDLDHFKPINDQCGHHVGDIVLATMAERINMAVRGCDFVARIGGDEFVAIIEEIKSNEDIIPIVERILNSIKESFTAENFQIEISCSIGIAVYPKDGDLDKLLVCADTAMYKAKEHGKNQFKFYDADIELASDQMLIMQRELRLAMANKEFCLVFQPKLDCKTLVLTGAEALIRWNHPTKGVILPREFLPAAERFGLINQINDWVAEECCRTVFRANQRGVDLDVSINLPQQQFRNADLVDNVTRLLNFYGLDASSLTFEIKETTALTNQEQFKTLISKFNAAGIRVTLDDFGLHPISLKYLQELNVKELKLDKVFVSVINENTSSRALINGVIQLAHALNLNVVAEGVENETQWKALVELGCDQMQGFLFSKPVPEERLLDLFKQLENKQMQIDFETSGQLLVSDYQL